MDKRNLICKREYVTPDGIEIEAAIYEKKSGSRMVIRYSYGEVEVYIPPKTTFKRIDDFVNSFLKKNPDKYFWRPFYKEDVYIYVLGKKMFFTHDASKKNSSTYFYTPSTTKDPINRYKKNFLDYLKVRVVELGKLMGRDLSDYTIRTSLFLTYYGCCFPNKKQMKFDYRLYAFAPEIIDSVIIHEIAHTYEMMHNDRFYSIVHLYCPDYDELQRELQSGCFVGKIDTI